MTLAHQCCFLAQGSGTAPSLSQICAQELGPWKGPPITVDTKDLTDFVGPPPFTSDRIYERTPVGVGMGLACTSLGGNALYIEAAVVERAEGKGSLKTTGIVMIQSISLGQLSSVHGFSDIRSQRCGTLCLELERTIMMLCRTSAGRVMLFGLTG